MHVRGAPYQEVTSASGSDDTRLSTNGRHATTFPSLLERKLSKPMFPRWNLIDPGPMFPHWNLIGRPTGPRLGSRRCAKEFNMILLAWVPDRATAKQRSLLDAKPSSAVRSSQHTLQCGQANMSFCCQTSVKTLSPSKTR